MQMRAPKQHKHRKYLVEHIIPARLYHSREIELLADAVLVDEAVEQLPLQLQQKLLELEHACLVGIVPIGITLHRMSHALVHAPCQFKLAVLRNDLVQSDKNGQQFRQLMKHRVEVNLSEQRH